MKSILIATLLTLLAGCAGLTGREPSAGATAQGDIPLYQQNPANCAEASRRSCQPW